MNATTGRPLLVFDGDCGFCTSSAELGRRLLRLDHVEPWQRLDLASMQLNEEQCEQAVQRVAEDGMISSAQDAVIEAFRSAGGPWAVIGMAMALPGDHRLAGIVYRWGARNRGKLPDGTPACQVTTQDAER